MGPLRFPRLTEETSTNLTAGRIRRSLKWPKPLGNKDSIDPKDSCDEERESELLLSLLRLRFLPLFNFFLCFLLRFELDEEVSSSDCVVADSRLEDEFVLRILESCDRLLSLSD